MSGITRRELGGVVAGLALGRTRQEVRRVALTMDDPHTNAAPLLTPERRDDSILETLARHELHAALFVCGMRVDSEEGRRLLGRWGGRGHTLANHTYSHHYFHDDALSARDYIADIKRGEDVVAGVPGFRRWFRFPMLKAGDTTEKRDSVRRYLRENGYRIGHVTIDTSDWYIDQRMRARLTDDPDADTTPYRDFYLDHMWERARYYDGLASRVIGRAPTHTLLLHHNLLNALYLGDLLERFREHGWTWVSPEEAYEDEVFAREPEILPDGESLVWALAKEAGDYESELRYPGEDSVYEKPAMDRLGL